MTKELEFKYLLRDTKTGYENWFSEKREGPIDEVIHDADFMWTEGNYSCDCNRSIFLWEWDNVPGHELACNIGKNQIVIMKCLVDGEEIDLELVDGKV